MKLAGIKAMLGIIELHHGDLKELSKLVKGNLTRTAAPSEADFVDAIYEAAVTLSEEPPDDDA